jgi:hypothetical protein
MNRSPDVQAAITNAHARVKAQRAEEIVGYFNGFWVTQASQAGHLHGGDHDGVGPFDERADPDRGRFRIG